MKENNYLRVTLVQVDLAWESPEENRQNLEKLVLQLAGNSDLVIFPETFTTGFSMHAGELSEPMDGPTIRWMLNLSRKTEIAICGSLLVKDNELNYNRFIFVFPDGQITFYNKRHLFSIGGEANSITPGHERVIVSYLGWRIALYVCYDLRFPVWCRNVGDTDLMIFTANWPESRNDVWNVLLKARAIENQVFVAGVNRIGKDGNEILYKGESQMINARGETLAFPEKSVCGLQTYCIFRQELVDFRIKFPVSREADQFLIR